MVEHEVLLTVINWNYNQICDNLNFFKIKTQDLPSFFSQKKNQVPVHDDQFLGRGTYRPVTLEFLELGLLIANQVKRILSQL